MNDDKNFRYYLQPKEHNQSRPAQSLVVFLAQVGQLKHPQVVERRYSVPITQSILGSFFLKGSVLGISHWKISTSRRAIGV